MSSGQMVSCERLPVKLERCPTCDHGIKFARSWTWVDTKELTKAGSDCGTRWCIGCPLGLAVTEYRAGLLWVGSKFYRNPVEFMNEAHAMGISRRIHTVPKGFVVGQTLVLLAHISVHFSDNTVGKGIFTAFTPTAIEYILKGGETTDELDRMEQRGITIVKVKNI